MKKHYVSPSGHLVELVTPPTVKDPVTKQMRLKDGWREADASDVKDAQDIEAERKEREANEARFDDAPSVGGPLRDKPVPATVPLGDATNDLLMHQLAAENAELREQLAAALAAVPSSPASPK